MLSQVVPRQSVFAFAALSYSRHHASPRSPRATAPRAARQGEAWWARQTRTCNQTVMSGDGSPENTENIDE
jgi:hypothetical protein